MIFGNSIDRSQIAVELKLVAENAWVLGSVRVKIARALRKSAAPQPSERAKVFEIEFPVISVALIFDEIYVYVDPVGTHHAGAALQEFTGPVPCRNGTFLVFSPEVVIFKNILTTGQ